MFPFPISYLQNLSNMISALKTFFFQVLNQWDDVLFLPSTLNSQKKSHSEVTFSDSCHLYCSRQLKRFVAMDANDGIPEIFYHAEEFADINYDHEMVKTFRSRILMEYSPLGNIIMHFDPVKLSFAYYCDQYVASYTVLNAVAMKYCCLFRTCHFFVDENIRSTKSPLLDILKEHYYADNMLPVSKEEKSVDPDFEFIKQNASIFKMTKLTKESKFEGGIEEKYRNKFVYLGRIRDFKPLQTVKPDLAHRFLFPDGKSGLSSQMDDNSWAKYKKSKKL